MKKSMMKVIAVAIAIFCIGVLVGYIGNTQDNETTTQSTTTTTTTETTTTTTTTTTETTTETTTQTTTFAYNTGITINEAMDALQDYYGDKYSVSGGSQEDNIKYFTVRDADTEEKYALVAVNLDTGEATETIRATNETSTFSLHG